MNSTDFSAMPEPQDLEQIHKAKYIRYNEKTKKFEKTNLLRICFEKIKGAMGFTDTTNKDFLAGKVFVYLQEKKTLWTQDNKERITQLFHHAGITKETRRFPNFSSQPHQLTPNQIRLKTLAYQILGSISLKASASSTEVSASFIELSSYITEKYPDFNINGFKSVKQMQENGFPFHFAIQKGDWDLFDLLKKAGGNLHQEDSDGNNILMLLSRKLNPHPTTPTAEQTKKILQLAITLIEEKVSPVKNNTSGENALYELVKQLDYAQRLGLNLESTLLKFFSPINLKFFSPINDENRRAAISLLHASKNTKTIKYLISKGLDIDTPDSQGKTALYHPDSQGKTALYHAVVRRDLSLIKFLIENGADPNKTLASQPQILSPLARAKAEKEDLTETIRNLSQSITPAAAQTPDIIIEVLQQRLKEIEDIIGMLEKKS